MLPYNEGGLNVGSLKSKNLALLCKWWWKFHSVEDVLWVRIIKSIFGRDGGLGNNSFFAPKGNNSTWVTILKAGRDVDALGIDFTNSFRKVIANGSLTYFWKDPWCGNSPLKDRYSRIFRLDLDKDAKVSDRLHKTENGVVFMWNWSRPVSGRLSGILQKLQEELASISFGNGCSDTWKWDLSGSGRWSSKRLTSIIDHHSQKPEDNAKETMLNRLVPTKVGLFVWRACQNRIPCRVELDKRGIDLDSVRCPVCDDGLETTEHSLLSCKKAFEVWVKIFNWWQMGSPTNISLPDLFKGTGSSLSSNFGKSVWQAVVWVAGYILWKHRNETVFKGNKLGNAAIVSEIQMLSHLWVANRVKGFSIDWVSWLHNPRELDSWAAVRTGVG